MKSFLRLSVLLLIVTSLVTSCKKSAPNQTRHIPKSAVFVASINTKSLQSKLMQNKAALENILKSATGNDTSVNKGKQEWEDLKESGIDLDDNFYVSVVQKGGTGMPASGGAVVVAGIGTLKDEAKLTAYLKKKQPKSEIRKEKTYSYITTEGDKMVAWGNDLVIMLTYQRSSENNMEFDTATGSFNFKNPVNSDASLKLEMESYFNMKEDESVAAIPEFRDLASDKGDVSMWVNSSSSLDNMALPLPKLKELLGNSFTAATLNFEDGKIAVDTKSYYSPELKDLLKKYGGKTSDLSLIENYPSDNINGFAVIAFDPELFSAVVKYLEVGGVVDGTLTKMMGTNYTLEEALKAIKGDFAFIVSDFAMPGDDAMPGATPSYMPKLQLIVNIPVGDKVQMNRLMDKLVEMRMLEKVNNEYKLAAAMQQTGYQVSIDDKNVLIASSAALLTQYKAKSKKMGLNKDVMDDMKGKPGVMYVNLESILNGIPAQKSVEVNNILPKAKETFKDMKAYSETFNGNFAKGHFELRFKNEKDNSLTSLLSFFETVSKNIPKTPAMDSSDLMMTDTTATMEPVK